MPASKKQVESRIEPPNGPNLLESFLASVENFVGQISAEAVQAAPVGEQQLLIQFSGDSLVSQTRRLIVFISETAGRLTSVQRLELDKFLTVADGEAIASRGVKGTVAVLKGGVLGNLLQWIAKHLEELKKILSEILHLIFDLLHIKYPDWIDKILHIIDEIFHLVLSLLSDVFGIGFRATASQLAEQEVDLLRGWAAFEAVRAVRAGGTLTAADET